MTEYIELSAGNRDWLPFLVTPYGGASTIAISSPRIAIVPEGSTRAQINAAFQTATLSNNGTAEVTMAVMVGPGGTIDPGPGTHKVYVSYVDGARLPESIFYLHLVE